MSLKNKAVLVTGGTGFLGRNLVPRIARQAKSVLVVSKEINHKIFSEFANVKIIDGNLTDKNFSKKVLAGIDVCFHLASFKKNFKYHLEHPLEVFSKNVLISNIFFEALCKSGVRKLVITSSIVVYGPQDRYISETDSLNLETKDSYALSKITLESNARVLSFAKPELSVVITRCDNFFGEFDNFSLDAQVVPSLIRKSAEDAEIVVWGSGNQRRTFVYVEDVCDALIKLAFLKKGFHLFNISSGEAASFKEIVKIIQKILGNKKKIIFDTTKPEGIKYRLILADKIKKELNWKPKFNLEKGLKKTIEFYLKNK